MRWGQPRPQVQFQLRRGGRERAERKEGEDSARGGSGAVGEEAPAPAVCAQKSREATVGRSSPKTRLRASSLPMAEALPPGPVLSSHAQTVCRRDRTALKA